MKYWVSELSPQAIELLKKHVGEKLQQLDLSKEEYEAYMSDLDNEKLGNLDEHLSYEFRLELSQMN